MRRQPTIPTADEQAPHSPTQGQIQTVPEPAPASIAEVAIPPASEFELEPELEPADEEAAWFDEDLDIMDIPTKVALLKRKREALEAVARGAEEAGLSLDDLRELLLPR